MKQQIISVILFAITFISQNVLSVQEYQQTKSETSQLPQSIESFNVGKQEGAESDLSVEQEPITYNIPLSVELQMYTVDICRQYNIDPALIFAIMFIETNYNPNINLPDGVGIMAIHPMNLPELKNKINIADLTDPEQNIKAGCYYLSQYLMTYQNIEHALIAYNCGGVGANKLIAQGINSTTYSRKVLQQYQLISQQV